MLLLLYKATISYFISTRRETIKEAILKAILVAIE